MRRRTASRRRSRLQVDPARAAWSPTADRYTLSGTVAEPKGLLDMYVLVNDQKVFFQHLRTARRTSPPS